MYDTVTNPSNFALNGQLNAEDKVMIDDGFTCMKDGDVKTIKKNANGELYVDCDDGRHFISGQLEDDVYIGLTKVY